MAAYEASGETDEWYTPRYIFDALGDHFDLDVAAPVNGPRHVPCSGWFSSGALERAWNGYIWMNPPFGHQSTKRAWLRKFFEHGNGIALVPDRTSAPWFQEYAPQADAICWISPKIKFERPDGSIGGQPGTGTALLAAGTRAVTSLEHCGLGFVTYKSSRAPNTEGTNAMNPILKHLQAGTLLRGDWGDGRDLACLYSAMFPGATSTANCPSEHMPQWFADIIPLLDDMVSLDGWEARMRRFALASEKFHVISPEGWDDIRRKFLAGTIRQAVDSARPVSATLQCWPQVESACLAVATAFEAGRDPTDDEKASVGLAAHAAAEATAMAAARAAWAAESYAVSYAAEAAAWDIAFDRLIGLIEAEQKPATE